MTIVRLGHVSFAVPELDRSTRFAEDVIGLRLVERLGDVAYLSSTERRHQLVLRAGPTLSCDEIAFDVSDAGALDRLATRASEAGLDVLEDADDPFVDRKLRFTIPNGPPVALCYGAATLRAESYSTLGVRPRKLGHVTIATPDGDGVGNILTQVLGMRLSDRLPLGEHADGELRWYRCNSDHHAIGITPGPAGVHHYAFEIDNLASFGILGDHLLVNGIRYIWGPGRHGPGHNLFAYFPDADGGMIEVYSEMTQIDDENAYSMVDWPDVESSANVWGPPPPLSWFGFSVPFASVATNVFG
jgi:catechol 2,3-dioxygenase